jgi:hypothetical protein
LFSSTKEEGFAETTPFVLKQNDDIYDSFYVEVYDKLYVPARGAASFSKAIKDLPYMKKRSKYVIVSDTGDLMKYLQDLGCNDAYTVNKSEDSVAYIKKNIATYISTYSRVISP